MIKGACHCGKVTFQIEELPPFLVSCNCSICRRLAAWWVHSPPNETVTLNAPDGATETYEWGDKSLAVHRCKSCGCTTHWTSNFDNKFAVNCRLADPDDIKDVRIRNFDGAGTWEWLD